MRALELTVYPPLVHPGWEDMAAMRAYVDQRHHERTMREAKRLTDAELAAEYWKRQFLYAVANGVHETARAYAHMQVIHRFATLPHHDEAHA